jgi:hypothetical protein
MVIINTSRLLLIVLALQLDININTNALDTGKA